MWVNNICLGGRKSIFLKSVFWRYSLFFFSFFCFFCVLVFHPADFFKQDYFFWPYYYFFIDVFQCIRFAPETDLSDVVDLFVYCWELELPWVSISIYGDDQISKLNPRLAAVVSEGLTKVKIALIFDYIIISSELKLDTLGVKNKIMLKY